MAGVTRRAVSMRARRSSCCHPARSHRKGCEHDAVHGTAQVPLLRGAAVRPGAQDSLLSRGVPCAEARTRSEIPKGKALINVLIAEEITLIRTGLTALLSFEPDIEVIAELERGDKIIPVASRLRPDVAIIGADLLSADDPTPTARLHDVLPECRTLILANTYSPGLISRGLAAHALGFLGKNVPSDLLIRSVRKVATGKLVIDPDLASADAHTTENPLTSRELDALRLAAEGTPTAEIADRLHITLGTVRNYLSRVIGKIGARNRLDAIRIATEAGWLLLSSSTLDEDTEPGSAAEDRPT